MSLTKRKQRTKVAWFLVGDTLGYKRVDPSSLDEILAACLGQTEHWTSVLMLY